MDKDVYFTIIEDLKLSHSEDISQLSKEIYRLEGRAKAHKLFEKYINMYDYWDLYYDIEDFIFEENETNKYAILECFRLFNNIIIDNSPNLNDIMFQNLYTSENLEIYQANIDGEENISVEEISYILEDKQRIKKLYELLGEEFCTKEKFDKYYYSTYLEKQINKNKSLIQELLCYCTREDLILYGIDV
jgi:hypothetical protein